MINLRVGCLLAACLVTASVAAQDPSSHSHGDRSAERRARFEGFMRSMDTNGNGIIEPSEVPAERRRMYEFMASRAGLPAGQPIPITQALEAMSQLGRPSGPPGNAPPANGAAPQPAPSPANAAASPSPPATPGVPGFGVNQAVPSAPGFGPPGTAVAGAASVATGAAPATPSASATNGVDTRSRGIAEMILRRYDRNQNGVLDKDEWGQMRNDPTAADRNHDSQITVDELAVWLVERGRERQQGGGSHDHGPGNGFGPPGGPPGPGMMPGPPSSGTTLASTSSTTSSRKSYRFLSPQERLPAGLPSWFTSQDTNHDGQVSMAEYTLAWSDEKAREFGKFDLNGDGMITPQECLRSATAATQGTSSQASIGQASSGQASGSPPPGSQAPSSAAAPTIGTGERPKAKSWWMTP